MMKFKTKLISVLLCFTLFSCEKNLPETLNEKVNKIWLVEKLESGNNQSSSFNVEIINLSDTKISKKSTKNEPFKFSGFVNNKERGEAGFWYYISKDTINVIEVYDYKTISSGFSGRFQSDLNPELTYFNKVLSGKWKMEILDNKMIWKNISNSSKISFKSDN